MGRFTEQEIQQALQRYYTTLDKDYFESLWEMYQSSKAENEPFTPVSQGVPPDGQEVQVVYDWLGVRKVSLGQINVGIWVTVDGGSTGQGVTHWKPKPNLP